jgi:hypothetical protein
MRLARLSALNDGGLPKCFEYLGRLLLEDFFFAFVFAKQTNSAQQA